MTQLSILKGKFKSELLPYFSAREIKFMFDEYCSEFWNLKEAYLGLYEVEINDEREVLFYEFVERLKSDEPFQQIMGFTYFHQLKIKLNRNVLIPRPETEELVYLIEDEFRLEKNNILSIIDLCSGSGCITLALKSIFKKSNVRGYEKSPLAIHVACENANNLKLDVSFIQCDILKEDWNAIAHSIDIIVSNPPYVLNVERNLMHRNVLDYEPQMALFVEDDDPLLFYRVIAKKSKIVLKKGGKLYFEINEKYGDQIKELLINLGYSNIEIKKDLQGKDRMIRALND